MARLTCILAALLVFLSGCAMLQPHHVTVHTFDSAPSKDAGEGAGGNFKASLAAGADVTKAIIAIKEHCTLCLLSDAIRDMVKGAFGMGADAIEGHDTHVTRTAIPLEDGRSVSLSIPTARGPITVIILAPIQGAAQVPMLPVPPSVFAP